MGFKHLHEANPFKKRFLIKASIYLALLTMVNYVIQFNYGSTEYYHFSYLGKEYTVGVSEGDSPIQQAKFKAYRKTKNRSLLSPFNNSITEKDLIKGSDWWGFWKMQCIWLFIGIVWVIARFLNRLFYGDDPHLKLDTDIMLFDRLFKSKKWGLNPQNSKKHKYTYISYSGEKSDIREIFSDEGDLQRAEIFSEEYYPNGNLKQINLRKSGINIKKRYSEERFQRLKSEENIGKIEVIKTFHKNGRQATESEFLFDKKSNSYTKVGLWTEWNKTGAPDYRMFKFKNGAKHRVYENGKWSDLIDKTHRLKNIKQQ